MSALRADMAGIDSVETAAVMRSAAIRAAAVAVAAPKPGAAPAMADPMMSAGALTGSMLDMSVRRVPIRCRRRSAAAMRLVVPAAEAPPEALRSFAMPSTAGMAAGKALAMAVAGSTIPIIMSFANAR